MTNTALTAGTTYIVSGFPIPKLTSQNYITASEAHPQLTRVSIIDATGSIAFVPDVSVSSAQSLVFSAFYTKQ